MSRAKNFIYTAAILIIIAIIAFFFFNVKLVLASLFLALLLTAYVTYKERIGQELLIAFLMAIALTSYYTYEYTGFNLLFGKINIFTLVSWTIGLVFLRELYEKVPWKFKFWITSGIYLAGLFLVEYIGYYLLNIRLNSNFPSLWNLGIIHAPDGMKTFYVLAGPVYLLITDYLKLKSVLKAKEKIKSKK